MRAAFITTLTKLARENKNIFLLTGDLGFSVFEDFQNKFPGRFFDVGVAEQNMIGISAGLALSGKIVFVYSIIPFVTMRCLEQIRNDLCMQNLNVKIIGMGAGLHYGYAGPTHHAIEDISIMRALPNMTLISPSTPRETEDSLRAAVKHKGPVYIRLSQGHGPIRPLNQAKFSIGEGIVINEGNDITIISTGSILYNAKLVTERLLKQRISVRLINMHTIKPVDKNIVLRAARDSKMIFTIEEHSIVGGLGSSIAEVLAESNYKTPFKRLALPDAFVTDAGNRDHLLRRNNLSTERLTAIILREFRR